MSEERRIYKTILVKRAVCQGKKQATICKVEIFEACQWKRNYKPYKRNVWPRPKHGESGEYWLTRYRVRVDGKWFNHGTSKYSFLLIGDIMKIVAGNM